ncbi:MAG: sensor histidine kinase [Candidatus Omnitrophica bacterium]|nr:sensor histidine kinase [Candidatus Omnitrophota bacterium]MCB9720906.1 sensor histidine kinase [Candidatus Omnitrophota bacterium]
MQRYLGTIILIIGIGMAVSLGIYFKYRNDISTARANYIQEEHYRTQQVATRIEYVFRTIYDGLRILTRLPGVKNIDRYAKNFDLNARRAVHEIYNNIGNEVALSELYILPLEFQPDRFDPNLGRHEEPIVIFDDRIRGSSVPTLTSGLDNGAPVPREDRAAEYGLMADQLMWLKNNAPRESQPMDMEVPAVSGPQVATSDRTGQPATGTDTDDRLGIVYSLPLYGYGGELKGMLSGVLLSRILEGYLGAADYVLVNERYAGRIPHASGGIPHVTHSIPWIERFAPNPDLVYSEVIGLDINDADNNWYLWAGRANEVFWLRQDVHIARQFAMLGFAGVFVLTASSILGVFLLSRHRDRLEAINQKLIRNQAMLKESQNRLKKFSGTLLSVREEEKKRLSRDLHDTVGSMAIGLNAKLKILEDSIHGKDESSALDSTGLIRESIRDFVRSFKHIALSLRPPQLEEVGFAGALEEYCEEIGKVHKDLALHLDIEIDEDPLSDELSIALYRVAQEALTNIIKHARATTVRILLTQKSGEVLLDVVDDGVGFDVQQWTDNPGAAGIGIIGIRERIESFGGEVILDSSVGDGTRLYIKVPLTATKPA